MNWKEILDKAGFWALMIYAYLLPRLHLASETDTFIRRILDLFIIPFLIMRIINTVEKISKKKRPDNGSLHE